MNPSPSLIRALTILMAEPRITPKGFAKRMWPDSPCWRKHYKAGNAGSHQGGAMYTAAGGMLGKLVKRGLASRRHGSANFIEYSITQKGMEVLTSAPKV